MPVEHVIMRRKTSKPYHSRQRHRPLLSAVLIVLTAPATFGMTADEARDLQTNRYESLVAARQTDQAVRQFVVTLASPGAAAELNAMTAALVPLGEKALPVFESLAAHPHPAAPAAAAELLWNMAQKNQLSDPLAALAAKLLEHPDPFARALAEWAIAIRVQMENRGQQARWPCAEPPEWFLRWTALTPEFLLEADYARLAIAWGIHRDGNKLLSSTGKIIERAHGAASEVRGSSSQETEAMVTRQLTELEAIRHTLADQVVAHPEDIVGHRRLWLAARQAARPIVLANPSVDFDQLVFVKRHSGHSLRNITGSQYPWAHKPGGDICVKSGLDVGGRLRHVVNGQLGPGHVHGADLWWQADRVVFGWASQPDWPPEFDTGSGHASFELRTNQPPTRLYEIRLDGSGLRQVTDHSHWSDFEPTYCANGDIVFSSDRSGRSSECGNFRADHTVINLFAVSSDGSNVRRLNDNKDIDRYPHSLDNGLIAYTRWEYQERHFFEVHAIWTMRPDGTMADAVYNQHLKAPFSLRDVRSIPRSNKLVAIAGGHHTLAYGPVVVVDPTRGPNAAESLRTVTPYIAPQEGPAAGERVSEGGVPDNGGLYQTPWALSERCFLVSYCHGRPAASTRDLNDSGFAIYLIDAHGNKELIHRDLIYSCAFPMPLKPRPRPPLLPDNTRQETELATCYVSDVYQGMEGVSRGTIKHLRISQRVGWPLDSEIGAMRYIPGDAWSQHFGFWSWSPVRVLGTVPVESDGSAHFRVPADEAVYFQALDENHMEIRRMRSHVTFQPGEVRGCMGCHETKPAAPHVAWQTTHALAREPRTPKAPRWGSEKLLGYEWLIQPILDRRCVRCHGEKEPAGGIDLAGRNIDGFAQSFRTMFGVTASARLAELNGTTLRQMERNQYPNQLVSISDRHDGAGVTRPLQFGSHQSRLVEVLRSDELHQKEAALCQDDWIALVTWIDANAPYHDTFFNRRPGDGSPPRRDIVIEVPASLSFDRKAEAHSFADIVSVRNAGADQPSAGARSGLNDAAELPEPIQDQ